MHFSRKHAKALPMSSDEVAISVRNVSKHYLMFDRPEHRLKQMIVPRLQRAAGLPPARYYRNFAALDGVSFEVKRGETVGIVGRNGSGKSTMLQVVCGTLNPTHGSVTVNGRIAALLELGAGFNPEFTGRENVYLNAAILGMNRQQVDERFDDIARFADIGQFINQPVKTYSSGMYVRLAFATAINVDPDILVVDEALAVGDEAFRRKCYARIEEIQDRGGTILFVSHGAQTIVQLCSRAILFDAGEVILQGEPRTVVSQYQRLINVTGNEAKSVRAEIRAMQATVPGESGAIDLTDESGLVADVAASVTPPPPQTAPRASGGGGVSKPDRTSGVPIGERFDPKLTSESRVEYESHGAQIRDLRLLNLAGEQVNVLAMGHRYVYEYFVDFNVDASKVGYGMMINTVSGLSIGGIGTGHSSELRVDKVERGWTMRVQLEFDAILLPGIYFMNAGVTGTTDKVTGFLHRILDGLAFRIAPESDLVATGLVDLGIKAASVVTHQAAQD
jgi:lipopolysaccharide transport system ATP-binding protein